MTGKIVAKLVARAHHALRDRRGCLAASPARAAFSSGCSSSGAARRQQIGGNGSP